MALSIANHSGGQQSDGANCGEEIRVVHDVFDANTPHNFPIAKPILSSSTPCLLPPDDGDWAVIAAVHIVVNRWFNHIV